MSSANLSAPDFGEALKSYLTGKKIPNGGHHILIACMQKTGSTYLAKLLGSLPDFRQVYLCPGDHREQEIEAIPCILNHRFNYAAHQHTRYSKHLHYMMLVFGIFPIVLTRNVFDVTVSMRDHWIRESTVIPTAYVPEEAATWDFDRQIDLIISFVLPWYANFIGTWSKYQGPCVRLRYEDLIADRPGAVRRIVDAAGVAVSDDQIHAAIAAAESQDTRKNKGVTGRGADLSEAQKDKIRALFSQYRGYVDLAQIGL